MARIYHELRALPMIKITSNFCLFRFSLVLGCTMPRLYSVLGLATDWTTRIDAQLTRLSATQLLRGPVKMAKQAIIYREN